jgi:peptidyl-prolyl cis-trans isomerase C
MVPEFAGAVVALKPGEYTHKAIQTQYGWHVIQLLETREVTAPPYDQVRQRLEQVVQAKKFRLYTDELMHTAKIEKFLDQPASGSAAPAAPAATPAAGAPGSAAPPASAPPSSAAPPAGEPVKN